MTAREWTFGDRVVHARRPEWGAGVVTAAQRVMHEGKPCQRLTIRFDRAGVKTISTALAELMDAANAPSLPPESASVESANTSDWLSALEDPKGESVMLKLPESATDPFSSLESRLKGTLALYRFTDTGASLLDWAASQSGLKDPLSRFNRHELEVLFHKFTFVRDDHLKKLVLDLKKKEPATLAAGLKTAPPQAQQTLRRLDVLR